MSELDDSLVPWVSPDVSLEGDILALVGNRRLSPTHRRIARYVIEHPSEAAFLTARELGERVGVSQPSVTRFAAALNFDGYASFQQQVRTRLLQAVEGRQETPRPTKFESAITADARNLEALRQEVPYWPDVPALGKELMGSKPLVVFGARASKAVAAYFGYFAAKIHPDIRVVQAGGSEAADVIRQAAMAGAECLLAFVLPRHPRESLSALTAASQHGLKCVTVTDEAGTDIVHASWATIRAPVGTSLVFDSQAAPVVVASILLEAMCDADPANVQLRLEDFESYAEASRLFT